MTLSVTPVTGETDADFVITWLEEAGATLLALPASGYTTTMRCGMPDVIHDFWDLYGVRAETIRPPLPSAERIDRMDQAWRWLTFIPADRYMLRRIVGARCLVHPVTDRYLFSWRAIGRRLGADHRAVQRWHGEGIGLIVAALHRRKFIFSA